MRLALQLLGYSDELLQRVALTSSFVQVTTIQYNKSMITITEEHLEELRTPRGGYTCATLKALGVSIKNNKGWRRKLIGKMFTDEQYKEALEGRSIKANTKGPQPEKININGKWYALTEL